MPTYLPTDVIVPDITIFNLTESDFNGNGVFDKLMKSVNAQILEQYQSDRITSDNYGTVYLGSLQAVLAQSVQFLLTKDKAAYDAALSLTQVKKGIEEVELVKSQKLLTDAQIDKTRQEIAFSIEQQTLISFERDKITQDILLTQAQVTKANKENELIDQQILKIEQEVLVLEQQVLQSVAEVDKTQQEVLLIKQQVINAQEQIIKTQAETTLLGQRTVTEVAQTVDGATGILGAQRLLYNAQAKGFVDDGIRRNLTAINSVYGIAKTNSPDAVPVPINLTGAVEFFIREMGDNTGNGPIPDSV
jgi:hypothetical protein